MGAIGRVQGEGGPPRTQHRPTEALWCALAGPTSAPPPPPKLTLGTHYGGNWARSG
ncbi:hypothetical protein [Klebsiella phage KA]|uniref:Uncharacterized protein n=1 Tax=Klebsiella phage KA TaxID=3109000 RepID=A0ABZ1A1U6_9CAUD|nr:hypothetical protein [Klebsiella phage KA]